MADLVLLLVALLGLGFLSTRLAEWLRIPHSVLLTIMGMGAGVLYNRLGHPLPAEFWQSFPQVVLFILLPPLIFESAYHLNWDDLRRDFLPVTALAVLGLVLSTIFIGLGLRWLGLPPQAAFLFGALISATDPVAVVALVRQLGAPRRLAILLEGESLLNDGTAIVLFRVLLAGTTTLRQGVAEFLTVVVGSLVVGGLLILGARLMLRFTARSGTAQVGLTVVGAYGSYIVADHWCHVSGVLCTMVVGLYLGQQARLQLNREAQRAMHGIWGLLALSANIIIFLAVGLEIADIRTLRTTPLAMVAFTVVLVVAARSVAVYLTLGLLNRTAWIDRVGWDYKAVLTWGGLRGGLALALVLTLPADFPARTLLLTLATAVVLCSLLVNALTTQHLIRLLRLDQLSGAEQVYLTRSLDQVVRSIFRSLEPEVERGALSGQLLEQMRERSLELLELPGESGARDPHTESFGIEQLLLAELQHYNERLEEGAISARAWLALRRSVERRLEHFQEGGLAALRSYEFERRPAPDQLDQLADRLALLLHHDFALQTQARLGRLEPAARELLEQWRTSSARRLTELYTAYPHLSTGVQGLFVSRLVAAAAENELQELLEAQVIGEEVYNRARAAMDRLSQDLRDSSRRLLRPTPGQLLRSVTLFEDLPESTLERLEKSLTFHRFPAGQTVFREGDPSNSLFLVFSGILEVRLQGRPPGAYPRLFPGSFFGELSLLEDSPQPASTVALVDCELAELPRCELELLMESHPQVRHEVLRVAAERRAADQAQG